MTRLGIAVVLVTLLGACVAPTRSAPPTPFAEREPMPVMTENRRSPAPATPRSAAVIVEDLDTDDPATANAQRLEADAANGVGVPRAIRRYRPAEGPVRGVVVAWHSFRDHRGAYDLIGPDLAASGWWVEAPDLPGHGAHPGRFGHLPADVDAVIDEARAVVERARRSAVDHSAADGRPARELPVVLLGESLGGAVAIVVAARYGEALGVTGVATAGAGLRGGIRARPAWDAGLWTTERVLPGVSVAVDPDYSGQLHPLAVERFANDPAILRRVRLDAYVRVVWLAQAATDEVGAIDVPMLYYWGGRDRTILKSSVCTAARAHPRPERVRVFTRPDWPHLVFQAPDAAAIAADLLTAFESPDRLGDDAAGLWPDARVQRVCP